MRSAYFPINRLYCIERESRAKRERETMSICEMVKTQKWYYVCNYRERRSAYFPINSSLHRERASEREQERESKERERLCPYVKW